MGGRKSGRVGGRDAGREGGRKEGSEKGREKEIRRKGGTVLYLKKLTVLAGKY